MGQGVAHTGEAGIVFQRLPYSQYYSRKRPDGSYEIAARVNVDDRPELCKLPRNTTPIRAALAIIF